MNLRTRLILILLAVGIVPAGGHHASKSQATCRTWPRLRGQTALRQIGQASIYDQALATAQQLQAYLRLHPEIDLSDTARPWKPNEELRALAVQAVGKTGYHGRL